MATSDQYLATRRAAGTSQARVGARQLMTFTVNGNTTVTSQVTLPAGSWFRGVTTDTPTAISGTPTTCNFRAGTAAAGQQVVADVDLKGQGHVTTTVVAALDKVGAFLAADTVIYGQVVTAGGTSSAGTIYAFVDYDPPVI